MKKILFFDVDDTLIHHRGDKSYIPNSTVEAINELQQKGYIVAIATGRGYVHIKHIMAMLSIKHAVCFNGHMLVVDEEVIYKETLYKEEVVPLVKKAKRNFFPIIAMDEEKVYLKDFLGKVKKALKNQVRVIEGAKADMFTANINKITLSQDEYYGMMILNKYFKKQESYPHLAFKKWGNKGYEVANKGTSKLSGIRKMAEYFGVESSEIYAFGDNYNDLEMLEGVENSIAMGNAVDEAKKVASYITDHVGEDGIEKACYYFGLIG